MTETKELQPKDIEEMLSENEAGVKKDTKDVKTKPIDLNNLSVEQIQNLKELFARTPSRVDDKKANHTVKLRKINDKLVVEWEQTYFAKKRDSINHMDVMKTIIPVRFNGDKKFTDILWREEFMDAEMVECEIVKMDTQEERKAVGVTYKRNSSGEKTTEEVERYVVNTNVVYTVKLPNNEQIKIDSRFIN